MKKLLKYMRGYGKECVLGPLFKLLEATFELFIPLVVAAIVDTGIANGDGGYIIKMCLVMVALGVIGLICAVTAVVFYLFPRQLLSLFTDDPATLTISTPYLRFVSWILFPKAINNVIGLCIRGTGDTRWMLFTATMTAISTAPCPGTATLRSWRSTVPSTIWKPVPATSPCA